MSTFTARTEADILAIVPRTLGFLPTDSIVVVGLGHAPTARLDLTDAGTMVDLLGPAMGYWTNGVVVVTYGATADATTDAALALTAAGINVRATITAPNGAEFGSTGIAEYDARRVAESRDALVADAETVTDVETAETLAIEAHEAGRGATAWAFLDRAVALSGGEPSLRMTLLDAVLRGAVPPSDWTA